MPDLKNAKLIYLKGALFALIMLFSSLWLLFADEIWQRAILIMLVIWSSARLYYFMFYVIEKYVDSEYRFAGLLDFLQYLWARKK